AATYRSPRPVRFRTHQQLASSYAAELSPSALVTATAPAGTVSVRALKAAEAARPGSISVTVRLPKSVEIVTSTGSSPVLVTRAVTYAEPARQRVPASTSRSGSEPPSA